MTEHRLTWRPAGNLLKVNILANLLSLRVHLENSDTALDIGPVNCHLQNMTELSAIKQVPVLHILIVAKLLTLPSL